MPGRRIIIFFLGLAVLVGASSFWYGANTARLTAALADSSPEFLALPTHRATSLDRSMFEAFGASAGETVVEPELVRSGVIPHHLIAGKYIADFFNKLKIQNPSVVALIGPNHSNSGGNKLATSQYAWRTPYGELAPAADIIASLAASKLVVVDEKVIATEHSIGALVPFIKRAWPKAAFLPIIVKSTASTSTIKELAVALNNILPKNSLVLASVDFSHYLPQTAANFHDALALNVLETGDAERVNKMEIDSPPSLYFLLQYNKLIGAENFRSVFHTNSAAIVGRPDLAETTSHIGGYFVSGAPSADHVVTLQFFGDIMLDRNVAKAMGKEGLDYIFAPWQASEYRFLQGMDVLLANLEGPFAVKRVPTSKSIAFRFDPVFASELKKYNFSAFSLANNHSYDMGRKNVEFTRQTLDASGLGYFGDELKEGVELTWLATSTPEPVAFIGLHNTYHEPDLKKVEEVLSVAKQTAKYVIVNIHWGEEYKQISNQKQRKLAHWLVDHGATVIVGHHPHVVQEMELYKDKPIFYSLGNFIFDQYFSAPTQEGLSVGLTLEGGGVKSIYLFPFYSVKSQVFMMEGERRKKFLEWFGESSQIDGKKIEAGRIEL
ncbi:MAG: AmmeMemoRadiSam system protein B [Candidatus Magasanikbacteria bacterium]|nr:AmmeMemoRadiSam system protein B [Candidatus Magasanikbacteria bacterium]